MKLIISVLMVLFSSLARAELSGNELLNMINSKDTPEQHRALLYIQGMIAMENYHRYLEDTLAKEENRKPDIERFPCMPAGSNYGQMMDVIKNYLERNPENRHYQAAQQSHFALINVWPCKQVGE